ncbi:MAG: FAD-dependent oxidoreductase [bacterium]|nr:FAD-dependent oxidoreductase [bacterium]
MPETLARYIWVQGGNIRKHCKVTSINTLENGFEVGVVDAGSLPKKFKCRRLILALPQLALNALIPYAPVLKKRDCFIKDVNSVKTMALTKINFYYRKRWWYKNFCIANGGCFTDLPVAQVYCFDPLDGEPYEGPAALTIYCDSHRSQYWKQLQAIGEPYKTDIFPRNPPHMTAASTVVVAHAQQQLAILYGVDRIPAPLLSSYTYWGSKETGDGDHLWAVGANDKDIRNRMCNPCEGIYVCGESYSDQQAWVEGALRSTERVLQSGFGLPPLIH